MAGTTPRSRGRRREDRRSEDRHNDRSARDGAAEELARHRGGWSGPGPDASDPVRLGVVVEGYVADRSWQRPIAEARVFAAWAEIVGADIAAHCAPASLREGELRVAAESTAWATQLRLLGSALLARVVAEVGPDVVRRIVVTGPTGPSWKHGPRSLRGGRGPRDTYG